ncbi:hypothetical protein HanXRQr2_Chr12g0558811 [Helianthus annuus]|uniref:Uncharacterized protein n=1 Tax=Helianthus annuus TaxID=4232 RepID=A0A9K3MXI4_HELAN|nr:hypothetical protein HanXRQr2_Chr12g0558811 [Helianthus annuus]KAJ0864118.1 hypothetical protein HanPSC8_Chr12g0537991 [Helianthus annuus]
MKEDNVTFVPKVWPVLRLLSKGLVFRIGSKRFEILPFSSGSLTPCLHPIFSLKSRVFPSFLLT